MFGFRKKVDPNSLINGNFGMTVAGSMKDLVDHFSKLDGWEDAGYDMHELYWMVGFLAKVVLERNRGSIKQDDSTAYVVGLGISTRLLQRDFGASFDNDTLNWGIEMYRVRVDEYGTSMIDRATGMNGEHFARLFFDNIQSNEIKITSGFEDHLRNFDDTVERIISKYEGIIL